MFSALESTFGQGAQTSQASSVLGKIRGWTRLSHTTQLLTCYGSDTPVGDGQIWEEEGTKAPLMV